MSSQIADIVGRMKKRGGAHFVTVQTGDLAELMALVAEEQAKSAEKLEQQTALLVKETVELRRLTRGLHSLTIAVAFFAFVQIVIMLLEYCSKFHGSP